MGSKLFVGGLAWATNEGSLRKAFEAFGPVTEAKIILDRDTGQSRGFGFVSFETEDDARKAMDQMNGAVLDGRTIRVNEAEGRSGGGGGGYNGGGSPPRPRPAANRDWGNNAPPQVSNRRIFSEREDRGERPRGRRGNDDRGGRGGYDWD